MDESRTDSGADDSDEPSEQDGADSASLTALRCVSCFLNVVLFLVKSVVYLTSDLSRNVGTSCGPCRETSEPPVGLNKAIRLKDADGQSTSCMRHADMQSTSG